jgi:hypothetical protein
MTTLILFTTRAPYPMADDLIRAGFRVFEALATSEVLHLSETEKIDIVVITAEVGEERAREIQHHYVTLRLKSETTVREIVAELWRLFPEKAERVQ